jgi:PhnB protein
MIKLNTYLNFAGNAEEAFNFYKSVFGGEYSSVVRFKDMPMEGVKIPSEDENKIMHIGLPIGKDDVLMASDSGVARTEISNGQQHLYIGSPG